MADDDALHDMEDAAEPEDDNDDEYPPDPDEPFDPFGDDDTDKQFVPKAAAARKAMLKRGQTTVNNPKTIPKTGKRILARQKQRQALELRKAGASYQQIADQLGYKDASGASKAVKRAFGNVIQEPVTDLKVMQIERLNHMLLVLWPKVQQGDERAISTSITVMDKIDRLMGTDASVGAQEINIHQNAVLVIDGDQEEYIRQMKRMAGIQSDGTNAPAALSQGPEPDTGADDTIVEGEVLNDGDGWQDTLKTAMKDGDSLRDHMTDQDVETVQQIMAPPSEPKKKFKFGVDPTVTRKKD